MDKLKPMSKELKNNFFKHLCKTTEDAHDLEGVFNVEGGIHKYILFSTEAISSQEILKVMNSSVYQEMVAFIETETGEDSKLYDRNITMFESETNDVNLIITW